MIDADPVGMIADIHRASVVDGPGVRTTVFLKGCPLSCIWCHNPETQSQQQQLGYNPSLCIGCGACVDVCPVSALHVENGKAVLNRDRCMQCMACTEVCPTEALFAYGRDVRVSEVLAEVTKDRAYYEQSGGGVTISGGEPMMQPDFTIALLSGCHQEGIHTCLDTAGIAAITDYERSLSCVDLYLFDYKVTAPQEHLKLTGVKRESVLHSLYFLLDAGSAIRLRCPLIPALNDTDEHFQEIARLSCLPGIEGVDLMPWHTMGMAKYQNLGRMMSEALPDKNADESYRSECRAKIIAAGAKNIR